MPVSQNGWSANDRSVIETYTIGGKTRMALRKGDAGFLLKHIADWFDANIKDIDYNYNNGELDDWGYAEREIRGGVELSNHASGTAIDVNATKWPLGVEPSSYLTADEIRRVREQLKLYEGAIRWGGDYTGRKDPMHFEINANAAKVAQVANKIRQMGDDDMPSAQEVAKAVWEWQIRTPDRVTSAEVILADIEGHNNRVVAALINGLLDTPIERTEVGRTPTTLRAQAIWKDNHVDMIVAAASNAKITDEQLNTIVSAVVTGVAGADVAAIAQAVNDEADRRNRDGNPDTGSKS